MWAEVTQGDLGTCQKWGWGTCLALRQLEEQRDDAQGDSFLCLEVRMCPEQELDLLFEGEEGKAQICKNSWAGIPESNRHYRSTSGSNFVGFLPVPHPSFTHQVAIPQTALCHLPALPTTTGVVPNPTEILERAAREIKVKMENNQAVSWSLYLFYHFLPLLFPSLRVCFFFPLSFAASKIILKPFRVRNYNSASLVH